MNITIIELKEFYSILDAEDVKLFANLADCSESFVRAVLRGGKKNEQICTMAHKRAKEKALKVLDICSSIEKRKTE